MRSKGLIMLILAIMILTLVSSVATAQPPTRKPSKGGPAACCVGCFFGTRAGYMYNEGVGIRVWEILEILTGIARLYGLIQIYGGKTWTEIEAAEGLRDPAFEKWHIWMLENKVYK